MEDMFDEKELRKLSPADRRTLIRALVALERRSAPTPGSSWKWDAVLVVIVVTCVLLTAWTGYLAVTLPRFYRAGSWRGAWVGFDLALLLAFATAGWAAWRRRQLLIVSLAVLATLLICDAWFDVVLDVQTPGFWEAVTSALVVELPLAVIAIMMARRLLRLTLAQVMRYEGLPGRLPPLWKIPLLGPTSGTPFNRLMQARAKHRSDVAACAGPDDPPASG
jgi:hypothetical protein